MRRIWAILAATAWLTVLALLPAASAHADSGERILSFDASYALQADGSAHVTETIKYQFAGTDSHGIKRAIITAQGYDPEPDKHRVYPLADLTVSSPSGAPADVSTSGDGALTIVRIGSPNRTVSGIQTYVVKYTLGSVVNKPSADQAELYWNVTGSMTAVPTDKVHVTVTGPASITEAVCYFGVTKSSPHCGATPGPTATFDAANLQAYEQVTIGAALPATAFTNTAPDLQPGSIDQATGGSSDNGSPGLSPATERTLGAVGIGAGVALPVLAASAMGLAFWKRGRDERFAAVTPGLEPSAGQDASVVRGGKQTIAVQFQPPAGVRPGLMGTVIDEEAGTVDVSATIVDLAVRGFLRMEEIERKGMFNKGDWRLTALDPPRGEQLLPYEQTLLSGMFALGSPVELSQLRNHFKPTLTRAQSQMYTEVVQRGWFRRSPQTVRGQFQMGGMALIGAGVFGFVVLPQVARAAIGLPIGLALAGAIVMLMGRKMASRTALGSAVTAQSLGFREYLVTAEASQIKFDEAEQIFSRYMPYAIVFGIAQQWADKFEQVARAAEAAGQPLMMPMWYLPMGGDFGNFGNIAGGIDDFGTVSAGTFASTPGSSGGSAFGGGGFSGGGGFAGGGGGGGGTGSW